MAERLYKDLRSGGVSAWIDSRDLKPGERWKEAIEIELRASDYCVAILSSRSLGKRGFVQKELKIALEIVDSLPIRDSFLVPVRLENCKPIDPRLGEINWTDLFPDYDSGLSRLLTFFSATAGEEAGRVLLVDDQIGSIQWLLDWLQGLGYRVDIATNEKDAKRLLDAFKLGERPYDLAIFDIMVATFDIMDLAAIDKEFLSSSRETGLRLARYVRQGLGIGAEGLPILCISARSDSQLRRDLDALGVPLFNRANLGSSGGEFASRISSLLAPRKDRCN